MLTTTVNERHARILSVWLARSEAVAARPTMPPSLRGDRPLRRSSERREKLERSSNAIKCKCGNHPKLGTLYCKRCKPKVPPTPKSVKIKQPPPPPTPKAKKKKKKKRSNPAIGFSHAAKHIARKAKNKPKKPGMTGAEWYAEVYLKSDWWRERRKLKLEACGRVCNRCRSIKNIQVHHLSYARKYAELDEDLEVLCKPCHEAEHGLIPSPDSYSA